jgi:NTP pyrophosphatase (non-canonical NTP hydrolase)
MSKSINELRDEIHQNNVTAGWWNKPREKGTLLMLIVSEVAEAMEGERKDLMDDHLPHRKMAEVELADAVIRILDYAGGHGYDIEGAMIEKLEYNKQRADHKLENRAKEGGKQF